MALRGIAWTEHDRRGPSVDEGAAVCCVRRANHFRSTASHGRAARPEQLRYVRARIDLCRKEVVRTELDFNAGDTRESGAKRFELAFGRFAWKESPVDSDLTCGGD